MSGHSKWANIKRKKGANDAIRGKITTKIGREITIAVRMGGGDPTGNMRLKLALSKAKANNIPKDNIQRAIQKGLGAAEGSNYEELTYEGYGPAGVAILCEALTDNRNRAASDVRVAFTRTGGSLADPGSVAYNFTRKGVVEVAKADGVDEDSILMAVLEAGAEEVEDMGESFEIYSEPSDIVAVRTALTEAGMDYDSAEVQFVAGTKVEVDVDGARKVFRLIDALEDSDDVQNVYTSVDLSPEVAAEFAGDED